MRFTQTHYLFAQTMADEGNVQETKSQVSFFQFCLVLQKLHSTALMG